MHKVQADDFSCHKCPFSSFLTGLLYVGLYGDTSVERGHLADKWQNVDKDLNYPQHKFQ